MRAGRTVTLILILSCFGARRMAEADASTPPAPPSFQQAQAALTSYDIEGDRSLSALRTLRDLELSSRDPIDAREAGFVRSVAAADLLLLSEVLSRPSLAVRVGRAYGVPRETIAQAITESLGALRFGPYEETAKDTVRALAALRFGSPWPHSEGTRSDVVRLALTLAATDEDDPTRALSRMAEDPCALAAPCSHPTARFRHRERKSARALELAFRALGRLRARASEGDPLVVALEPLLTSLRERIMSTVLEPAPPLPANASLAKGLAGTRASDVDLLLFVGEREVRYGFAPRIRLDARGKAELSSAGKPTLPETGSIRLPWKFRPAITPVKQVVSLIEPWQGARVAVGAEASTEAHVLARILYSVQKAGLETTAVVGRGRDGGARTVAVRVARAGSVEAAPLRVHVRLGGYGLSTREGRSDIPRIRRSGSLSFDGQALASYARPFERVAVGFMSIAQAGPVVDALFRVGGRDRPVTLLLP